MGGSIRIPAACCGVAGLKPSFGRIPMTILPSVFDSLSHFGPLARSVEDAVAFMSAAAGPRDEDIQSVPLSFSAARTRRGSSRGRRIAPSVDLGYYAVQPDVEKAVRAPRRAAVPDQRAGSAAGRPRRSRSRRHPGDGRYAGFDMTLPFNMVPQCPSISLPAGFSRDGLPVGLQLVGKRHADEDPLAMARRLEALLEPLLSIEKPTIS